MNKDAGIMLTFTRQALDISQEKFAAFANSPQARASDYERGITYPTYEYVEDIAINAPSELFNTWLVGYHFKKAQDIHNKFNEKHNLYEN